MNIQVPDWIFLLNVETKVSDRPHPIRGRVMAVQANPHGCPTFLIKEAQTGQIYHVAADECCEVSNGKGN